MKYQSVKECIKFLVTQKWVVKSHVQLLYFISWLSFNPSCRQNQFAWKCIVSDSSTLIFNPRIYHLVYPYIATFSLYQKQIHVCKLSKWFSLIDKLALSQELNSTWDQYIAININHKSIIIKSTFLYDKYKIALNVENLL